MGEINGYKYPDIDILEAISVVEKILNDKIERTETLADALGHKSASSGGFKQKLTALKRYGLISGRLEDLRATKLAENITLAPKEEKRKYIHEAVSKVGLLKDLYKKRGKEIGNVEELRRLLYDMMGKWISKGNQRLGIIQKVYNKAVPYLSEVKVTEGELKREEMEEQIPGEKYASLYPDVSRITYDEVSLSLPKRMGSIEKARRLLEVIEKELKEKEKEQSDSNSS